MYLAFQSGSNMNQHGFVNKFVLFERLHHSESLSAEYADEPLDVDRGIRRSALGKLGNEAVESDESTGATDSGGTVDRHRTRRRPLRRLSETRIPEIIEHRRRILWNSGVRPTDVVIVMHYAPSLHVGGS